MSVRRKTPAFVALAAAYAVVLQTVLLAICGALVGGNAPAAASLCAPSPGGERQPWPAGHGDDCLSACFACCCGMAVAPAPGSARADLRGPVQRIAAPAILAAATPHRVGRAHRSRGPPLGRGAATG
jgi:hypothetical protein